nr:K(+)-transporting ATPase subunit F [Paenibacillus sp. PL91]
MQEGIPHDGCLYDRRFAGLLQFILRIFELVRQRYRPNGRRARMIIVMVMALFIFVYLIYALIHPEKF